MIVPAADTPLFSAMPFPMQGVPSTAPSPLDAFPSVLRNAPAPLVPTAMQQGAETALTSIAMAVFPPQLDVDPDAVQEEGTPQDNTTEEEEVLALQSILQSLQALLHPLQAGVTLSGQVPDVSQGGEGLRPYGTGVLAGGTIPLTQAGGAFPPAEEVSTTIHEGTLGDTNSTPLANAAASEEVNPMTLLNATANGQDRLAEALPPHALRDPAQLQETDQHDDIQSTATQGEGHVLQDHEPVMQMPPHFSINGGTGRAAVSALPATETPFTHLAQHTAPATLELAAPPPERLMPRQTLLLQLHPPELGTMQIRVRLANEQLSASFWADSPEVRTLLQTHFPSLHQNLSAQGFQVQHISMSFTAGDFAGYPGQSAQQQEAFQSWSQSQQQPVTAEGGREATAISVVRRSLTRRGFVDVII
jgi:hypothetical protein